jgi:hypothetical protein
MYIRILGQSCKENEVLRSVDLPDLAAAALVARAQFPVLVELLWLEVERTDHHPAEIDVSFGIRSEGLIV